MALGYQRFAGAYDRLARLYSLGAISRTQASATAWIRQGDRVLVAGCGTAPELDACSTPHVSWVLVDASSAMLDRARRRQLHVSQRVDFVHGALQAYNPEEPFDVVLAPFFLNVFRAQQVPEMLECLVRRLRPGGSLIVADFASGGSWWLNFLRRLYYLPPLILFRLLANNPWHELYDYAQIAQAAGLPLRVSERRSICVLGVPLFETITFTTNAPSGGDR